MTMTDKKSRGRPTGTGINDEVTLDRIADLIARSPGLKPTTALKRVTSRPGPAQIRRIQVKWKLSQDERMARAESRLAAQRPRPAPAGTARRTTAVTGGISA